MSKKNTTREEAIENAQPGGTHGWCLVVFGEELLTKRVRTGTFLLLKRDLGLTKIVNESCLFMQKRGLNDQNS